jgi:hypothetical protein
MDITKEEAALLISALNETVRSGRLDDSIRHGGMGAIRQLSDLSLKLEHYVGGTPEPVDLDAVSGAGKQ